MRGKTLGLAGLGRIGQEVARRAAGVRHDASSRTTRSSPRRSPRDLGVELVSLDDLCARADYLSLHMPSTPQTRHIFNAERLAHVQEGHPHHQHRARRADRRGRAGRRDRSGQVGGAALDVFTKEPTDDHALQQLPQVVATPHIAASTREGQELVGVETAAALRDFLQDGVIRNAVNFPSVSPEEFQRLQPFVELGEQLGCLVGQMGEARIESARRPLLRRAGRRARNR